MKERPGVKREANWGLLTLTHYWFGLVRKGNYGAERREDRLPY